MIPCSRGRSCLVELFPTGGTSRTRRRRPLGIVVGSFGGKGLFAPGLRLLAHADKVWTDHQPDSNQDRRVDDVVPRVRDDVAHDDDVAVVGSVSAESVRKK